jgi:glycosyltransferase involved in cell wall biosynthesis
MVSFCSLYEGFGNGLLEAIYFKKPIILNRYEIFVRDIEPLGFEFITMDGYLTADAVAEARGVLNGGAAFYTAPEKNYAIASRHFSYQVLHRRLSSMLTELTGNTPPRFQIYRSQRVPAEEKPFRIAV